MSAWNLVIFKVSNSSGFHQSLFNLLVNILPLVVGGLVRAVVGTFNIAGSHLLLQRLDLLRYELFLAFLVEVSLA